MARTSTKKGKAAKARRKPATRRTAKAKAKSGKVARPDALDAYIDSASAALNIPVAAEWKPAVKANLQVIFRFADNVVSFSLPDDAEPAPLFRA
jgi:hypothetical protein